MTSSAFIVVDFGEYKKYVDESFFFPPNNLAVTAPQEA